MSYKLVVILAYTVAIPAGVGLLFFKSIPKPLRTLSVLFAIGTLFEALATLFTVAFRNNLVVINSYVVAETVLVLLFISQCLQEYRKVIIIAQCLTIVVGVYETLATPDSFNAILSLLESLLAIAGLVLIFVRVAFGKNINRHVFWMAGVLLLYFVTNAVYFGVRKHLDMNTLIFVSVIHVWINVVCNLAYAVILWISRSRSLLFA